MRPFAAGPGEALRAVAQIGYRSIETIGAMGLEAERCADLLKENGIRSPSMHACPASFYDMMVAWDAGRMPMKAVLDQIQSIYSLDRMPYVLEEAIGMAGIMEQRTVVWSNLTDVDLVSAGAVSRIAAAFEAGARQCADAGMRFAFHNGSKGFVPVNGKRPYDILLEETDPAHVKMEIDVYWAYRMGIDPIAYMRDNPSRFHLCHLKDMNANGDIVGAGKGVLDFAEIFRTGAATGVETYYVEYDQAPEPMASIRDALAYLQSVRSTAAS
ncbi:sugar phosphate isomerase/epimerase family protein [Sphingobium ummariense]|uniref:Xylose isomerase-like TIM barrel domain-containing protein n=1 Tax=Sphingobium ummariense RL-3 TaxID=1346791 RepID=T0J8Q9_9SPHN|nr:sugar phosphate isomerase/epimerase [Sphingobium ummariense]EQB33202.1 hypothetical protein M529_05250 [Sphingobium ummariense RL-3]